MKRLFIGFPIESKITSQVAESWKNDWLLNQNRMIWATHENWHITLFFLGGTPESLIDMLTLLITESFSQTQPFVTQLIGTGVFPNIRNPKILWLGLENLQPLMPAYAQLGDLLRKNGLSLDNKPLKPHLTLARIRNIGHRSSLESLLNEYQQFNFGTVAINSVVLYESILTPSGPVYKPLFEQQLKRV